MLVVSSVLLGGPRTTAAPGDEFDKDAFRSRKRWYVTFTLQLKGKGEATITELADHWKTKWRIQREVSGTFVLDEVRAGANSRPRGSETGDREESATRYVSWDATEGVSNATWFVDDRVEHESVTHGEIRAPTNVSGFTKLAGAGMTRVGRNKELKCDLKEMVFDHDLSGLRYTGKERADQPKHLLLTGEYHSETPATRVVQDLPYPMRECGISGVLPQLTETLRAQLLSRPLVLVKDRISFTVSEPVTTLPYFPEHPGPVPGGREKFNRGTTAGGPPLQLSLEVVLSPTPPSKARLLLRPLGYDAWRPLCGESETSKGNDLAVEWRVEEEGVDSAQTAKATRVVFALMNTSKEPGVCTNWPLHANSPAAFDLRFAAAEPLRPGYEVRDEGQSLTLTAGAAAAGRGSIKVDSFDSGATGALVAEATLDDGRLLKAEVDGTGAPQLLIPDFSPGESRIARWWRTAQAPGKSDDADDEDFPKGDGQVGDGLTVWEEYRGFRVGGEWDGFCDPKTKDLFLHNGIGGAAKNGIWKFQQITELIVHDLLAVGERRADRVVNFNTGARPHVVDQHCLELWEGGDSALENASVCTAEPGQRSGPPKNTMDIVIFPPHLRSTRATEQVRKGETYAVATADNTIAHELCHGIGVRHHGESDSWANVWTYERSDDGVLTMLENGRKIRVINERTGLFMTPPELFRGLRSDGVLGVLPPGAGMNVWVGERHGQHGGDEACLMRYDVAQAYRSIADPSIRYFHGGPEIVGNRLCTSPAGTGVNMPTHEPQSRYGGANSKRGDCAHQFVVSDRWEAKQ